jgi:hemerythrin
MPGSRRRITAMLEWKDEYSVNVKEIDEQHKTFVKILDDLFTAFYDLKLKEQLGKIFDQLTAFTEYHFSTEEKYFIAFAYEETSKHAAEHTRIKVELQKFRDRYDKGEKDVIPGLFDFLEAWLIDHLDTYDKKYTKCFNEHGLH